MNYLLGVTPAFSVEPYGDTRRAFNTTGFDLIIFDGASNSDRQTSQLTQKSHLVIIPTTDTSLDDLGPPSIKLAHELRKKGIDKQLILMMLNNVSGTEAEAEEAVNYIKDTGYPLLVTSPTEQPYAVPKTWAKLLRKQVLLP